MSQTPEAPLITGPSQPPQPIPYTETPPSLVLEEGPNLPRLLGFAGLFLFILGSVAVIANRATETPRLISENMGFLGLAAGLVLMFYHAITDNDNEVRRLYGLFAVGLLFYALAISLIPGPIFSAGLTDKRIGYNLLPWGVGSAGMALLFLFPFLRHETEEGYRQIALLGVAGLGGVLAVGSVLAGTFKPAFLTGPGLALTLLGLGFLWLYLSQVDTTQGLGYTVAVGMGIFGGLLIAVSILLPTVQTLLYDGPTTLRLPSGELSLKAVVWRLVSGGLLATPAILAWLYRSSLWWKALASAFSIIGVGAVLISLFTRTIYSPPTPFLVPTGLILMGVGVIYLLFSLSYVSDSQFVALARRELAAYFLSPIGYLVLVAMVILQWAGYYLFVFQIVRLGQFGEVLSEPIVSDYYNLLMVFAVMVQVPALTMRLLAEERRTGTLEVLLTAPVNEWPVVLSKFLATWLFFLLTWLPSGLYLIALRTEIDSPFDYRPLLSFYVSLMAQGVAFIGMGLFFSSLTRNQVIAAVLTFVGMMFFLLCYIIRLQQSSTLLPSVLQVALGRLSFYHMWEESLAGRLPLRDALLFASLGIFWLFLCVKVLEARKWL
ncbi:MAG: ABC transporter permease [Thermogemmata sp.]|nr:ABC transporter permease [Thermogemmata sp.]